MKSAGCNISFPPFDSPLWARAFILLQLWPLLSFIVEIYIYIQYYIIAQYIFSGGNDMTFLIYVKDGKPSTSREGFRPFVDHIEYMELSDSMYPEVDLGMTDEKVLEYYNREFTPKYVGSYGLKEHTFWID